ncbi:MAG: DNA-directed RNA polymerase subunit E [Thermoplasmata archaeon]|nr:MAG: DNA-directed RNA polymerase subunit E [Thermoplasmata archaeon]
MKTMYACKVCHIVTDKDKCPICGAPTSKKWKGYVVIFDPTRSLIAQKMSVTKAGEYALRVR